MPSTAATSEAGSPALAGLRPMLAVAGTLPADPAGWAFEFKWDGIRALVGAGPGGGVQVVTRNGRDVSRSWPELAPLAEVLRTRGAVLDGEIVSFDDQGRTSFQRLQERMHVADRRVAAERSHRVPAVLLVFDLLHVDGSSLLGSPWTERREALESLDLGTGAWTVPPAFPGEGPAILEAARQQGLEGVVAKRLTSAYLPGRRSRDWIKIVLSRRDEFVIGGWLPGEGNREGRIGSLLLGRYDRPGGELVYAGNVGTGFTGAMLAHLEAELAPLRRSTSPFGRGAPKRGSIFVEPALVAEVEYRERTRDGILRHPSFKGLRPDKAPADATDQPWVHQGDDA